LVMAAPQVQWQTFALSGAPPVARPLQRAVEGDHPTR
jgi:hypothetical protein